MSQYAERGLSVASSEVFDPCLHRFFFVCPVGAEKRKLLLFAVSAGATRVTEFDERVTHVIVGENGAKEAATLTSRSTWHSPSIVNSDWLWTCAEDGRLAVIDPFLIPEIMMGRLLQSTSFSSQLVDISDRLMPESFSAMRSSLSQQRSSSSSPLPSSSLVRQQSLRSRSSNKSSIEVAFSSRPSTPSTPSSSSSSTATRKGVLSGERIAVTGFQILNERNAIKESIANLGAEYTSELSRNNSHLIAFSCIGAKYEFARSRNIPIVSKSWLDACVKSNRLVETKLYEVIPGGGGSGSGGSGSTKRGARRTPLDAAALTPTSKRTRLSNEHDSVNSNVVHVFGGSSL